MTLRLDVEDRQSGKTINDVSDSSSRKVSAMNRRIIDRELTEEQVREIEAACKLPYVEDEDCPQIDPQRTPELWEEMMKALAERNRKMAQRMA